VSAPHKSIAGLLQFGVFGFGLLQERQVGVGVLPECEEILICGLGSIFVSRCGASARQAEVSQGLHRRLASPFADALAPIECLPRAGP